MRSGKARFWVRFRDGLRGHFVEDAHEHPLVPLDEPKERMALDVERFTLEQYEETIAEHVTTNIFDRHIHPLFLD